MLFVVEQLDGASRAGAAQCINAAGMWRRKALMLRRDGGYYRAQAPMEGARLAIRAARAWRKSYPTLPG